MAKILDFSGERGPKRFEFCYQALLLGGGNVSMSRDNKKIRIEAKLLDAMECIAVPDEKAGPTDPPLKLDQNGGDPYIVIDEIWQKLLLEYLEGVQWNPRLSREAVDAMDFVAEAKDSPIATQSRI